MLTGMTAWFPQSSRESDPLFYVRGHAVDVSLFLVFAHIASMLVCFTFIVSKHPEWVANLEYTSHSLASGHVWNLFLYPFIHDIAQENVFFLLGLASLFWFGRPVEHFVGKTGFILLYTLMAVVPALIITFIPPLSPALVLSGSSILHFGIFIAFSLIYPNSQLIFGLITKWVAFGLLVIETLASIEGSSWTWLACLWLTVLTAWAAMQFLGTGRLMQWVHDWNTAREAAKLQKRRKRLEKKENDFHSSVDSILEKISREGIQSLTSTEREHLERARAKLLRGQQKN